jgi:acyl-homoserine lactone acylase PvdQ
MVIGYNTRMRLRGYLLAALTISACLPASAVAYDGDALAPTPPALTVPQYGTFRSVLAQGEGQTTNTAALAANEVFGTVPNSFTNQTPLYSGIMPHATTLTASELNVYYKNTNFGSMPGGVGAYESPRPGVEIYFDKQYGMAHIYANNFNNLMWASGYEQAQERLFLMDVLRREAEGSLAALLGPSQASGDAGQLTDQDYSQQELTEQADDLPKQYGAPGAKALDALQQFVAGINARMQDDELNPLEDLPAEYLALGILPQPWKLADSAAEAILLETQFTVSGGSQQVINGLQQQFQKRFGKDWMAPYDDLSEPEDPAALTIQSKPVDSARAGKIEPQLDLNADLDAGSLHPANDLLSGPSNAQQRAARATLPGWGQRLEKLRKAIPTVESNAVLVASKLSSDGNALGAMGPQVGYYSPQIFSEYEIHGGGINSEGVVFPGADPFPLIGHGIDFAWSGTSANGIDQDTYAELLCNPNGSKPSDSSTHYMYDGKCIPFVTRDQSVETPPMLTSPEIPQKITYRAKRSVHGPVFAYATVRGAPVALTLAKALDFHELRGIIAFMELSENLATSPQTFRKIMSGFPGTETWFYVDQHNIAYQESGFYPEDAPHSNPNLPYWGTGKSGWVDFNASTYTEQDLPPAQRPGETDPRDGYLISWNNKEAPGWYLGPDEWDGGPIQHALILKDRLLYQVKTGRGKTTLVGLARAVNATATTDLREYSVFPVMAHVLGRVTGPDAPFLALLKQWHTDGSQRLAPAGSNVYGDSAAVALMDAWWPLAVKAIFEPALGPTVFQGVLNDALGLPPVGDFTDSSGGYAWTGATYTDLRDVILYNTPGVVHPRGVLPEEVQGSHIVSWDGSYGRIFCGNPSLYGGGATLAACRAVLLRTLSAAIAYVESKRGDNPAIWTEHAVCAQTNPSSCDQEVPNTAGAISTPPFPWQDRGTYHQLIELTGHRPVS